MKKILVALWVSVVLALALVAGLVVLPYYAIGPGPPREIQPLIRVEGSQTYPSSGKLIMTTIRYRRLTAAAAVLAWLDPEQAVVEQDVLFPAGESPEEEERRSISQMDTSKIDATAVALRRTSGYPRERGRGALIRQVVEGCSADAKLYPGDVVRRINDRPIARAADASDAIESIPPGDALTFVVRPLGEQTTERVRLVRTPCGGSQEPLVGVSMLDTFPFEVTIESGDIGGPSAGLMYALGVYDLLTPGDLTGDRVIAGTGTIDPAGVVGPIGGIEEKVLAAGKAKAQVLLVPVQDMPAARAVAPDDLELVSIATVDDALAFLDPGAAAAGASAA